MQGIESERRICARYPSLGDSSRLQSVLQCPPLEVLFARDPVRQLHLHTTHVFKPGLSYDGLVIIDFEEFEGVRGKPAWNQIVAEGPHPPFLAEMNFGLSVPPVDGEKPGLNHRAQPEPSS